MWKQVWSGFEEGEIPIMDITNGIHMQSWAAPEMKDIYQHYLGIDWYSKDFDKISWDNIDDIPDKLLWQTHADLKGRMVEQLKKAITYDCERRGITPKLLQRKVSCLDPNALIIGFARRFAAYKRATLIFEDPDRLLQIIENAEMPVQFIFSGKAHPNDEAGKRLIKTIYGYTFEERFFNKIFFIENYDLGIAQHLVRGVDVWLNNPSRPREASGTSGMKVVVNGGLNVSILDGWWDEAYEGDNGWAIGKRKEYTNPETQNLVDSQSFYEILENSIIPAYCKRSGEGIPDQWVHMMKQSIKTLVPQFNTHRMLREYYGKMYLPVARRSKMLQADNFKRAKALADWKMKIASRFSTDHIRWYKAKGFRGDLLDLGDEFKIEVGVDPGKLIEDEIRIELVILESDEQDQLKNPIIIPMERTADTGAEGTVVFTGHYEAVKSGKFVYGIRVIPSHPDLLVYQELGLVHWA
jgi:glucan phosphorylase